MAQLSIRHKSPLLRHTLRRAPPRAQARLDIANWIEGFYNRQRLHSAIGYRTPVQMEAALKAAWAAVRETGASSNWVFQMPNAPLNGNRLVVKCFWLR